MSDDYSCKITLNKHPIYTSVEFDNKISSLVRKEVMRIIRNVVRARPDGYMHMPRFKQHFWDGYISLMQGNDFPTGLIQNVLDALEAYADDYEYMISVKDYPVPDIDTSLLDEAYLNKLTLRNYQLEAAGRLIFAERGVAHMATNSGKTVVMAILCKLVNSRTLILTHKKELLYQTKEVIEKLTGLNVSIIGDGNVDFSGKIVIAMVQTLGNIVEDLRDKKERFGFTDIDKFKEAFQMLIVDEVHHVSSKSMMDIVMEVNAPFRFGFSGTPLKNSVLSDMQLMAATGQIVIRVSNEELIDAGYSATPEIMIYSIDNELSHEDDDYPDAYRKLIVENKERNTLIAGIAWNYLNEDNVILILVDQVKHQKLIYDSMCKLHMGYEKHVTSMNGSHSMDYRNENIQNMRDGNPHVYVSTEILGEGVDIPAIDVLILAGGGKSHIRTLQRVGRGMRRKENKENKLLVIDFRDVGNKYLEEHSERRSHIYSAEGFKITELTGV